MASALRFTLAFALVSSLTACEKKSFLDTSAKGGEGSDLAAARGATSGKRVTAAVDSVGASGSARAIGSASAPSPAAASGSAAVLGSAVPPSAAGRLLVTNEDSGDITVIDLAREEAVAKIPVGKRPRGIRPSPDGKLVFVALSGSAKAGPGVDESKLPPADRAADGIGVLDTSEWKVARVLKSGQDPEHFDVSKDGKTIFVSNEETGEASSVDVATGEVTARIKVGDEPEGVTLRPDGKVVYVTSEVANQVAAVDVGSRKVLATIETAPRPRSLVFTEDGKTAFVACETAGQVTVIDAVKHKRRTNIKIDAPGARPMGTALSPDGKTVFVTNGRGGSVTMIDVAGEKIEGTISGVGTRPWGIAVSADGTKIYTANGPSNDVSVIDVVKKSVLKKIPAGGSPWGVAITK